MKILLSCLFMVACGSAEQAAVQPAADSNPIVVPTVAPTPAPTPITVPVAAQTVSMPEVQTVDPELAYAQARAEWIQCRESAIRSCGRVSTSPAYQRCLNNSLAQCTEPKLTDF
jgi:hypothetical protein